MRLRPQQQLKTELPWERLLTKTKTTNKDKSIKRKQHNWVAAGGCLVAASVVLTGSVGRKGFWGEGEGRRVCHSIRVGVGTIYILVQLKRLWREEEEEENRALVRERKRRTGKSGVSERTHDNVHPFWRGRKKKGGEGSVYMNERQKRERGRGRGWRGVVRNNDSRWLRKGHTPHMS